MNSIKPQQLQERTGTGAVIHLLDVRTPAEYAGAHVPGGRNVPLDRLEGAQLSEVTGFGKNEPVYILCQSGGRARMAAEKLAKCGYEQCYVVEGGTAAWAEAGLPMDRTTKDVISLERQVRIAAGVLVLAGVLLAEFVHPAFVWLSGFVGAGLIFAGATDWCGMGMLIGKMPWNGGTTKP